MVPPALLRWPRNLLPGGTPPQRFMGRLTMWTSKSLVWLITTMMLLSMGFVLYPQGSANAATYCAQLRGATAAGHPDCSFSTLDKCRARVRHRGGGHCYKSH